MASGKAIKLGIIVAGFATAGILFATSGGEESEPAVPPDADELDLICTACGHHFTLAAAALDEQVARTPQPVPSSGEGEGRFRFSGRRPKVVPCPECSENAAVLATLCPEHGSYFPSKDMEGERGSCPECR
jgi:hypothetical protein